MIWHYWVDSALLYKVSPTYTSIKMHIPPEFTIEPILLVQEVS